MEEKQRNRVGYYFATNNYFAEELGVHPKTVSSWISDLRDKNLYQIMKIRGNILKNFQRVCMQIRIKNLKKISEKNFFPLTNLK